MEMRKSKKSRRRSLLHRAMAQGGHSYPTNAWEEIKRGLYEFTKSHHSYGPAFYGRAHLDYFSTGYVDPPGHRMPCLDLELLSLLSHRSSILPETSSVSITVCILFTIMFVFYAKSGRRETDEAISFCIADKMEKKYWKDQQKKQIEAGIRMVDVSVRPDSFQYEKLPDERVDVDKLPPDWNNKLVLLNAYCRATVPNLVVFRMSVYLTFFALFVVLCTCTSTISLMMLRFNRSAPHTFLWLCETTVAMAHHMNYRMKKAWIPTGLSAPDMCLLDASAQNTFGRLNASAFVYDRTHHNLQRTYLDDIRPSVTELTFALSISFALFIACREFFMSNTRIPMDVRRKDPFPQLVFITQSQFVIMRNVILFIFLLNTFLLLRGLSIRSAGSARRSDCQEELEKLTQADKREPFGVLLKNQRFAMSPNNYAFSANIRRKYDETKDQEEEAAKPLDPMEQFIVPHVGHNETAEEVTDKPDD